MTDIEQMAILTATDMPWQLIYHDEHLLVVDKPAMLLTVPGRHPANHDCLISRVQREFPSASVVHRLDYDTSGLVILPLNKKALSAISVQFQQRVVEKTYHALVAGQPTPSQGCIDLPLAPDLTRRPLSKVCATQGKPSLTWYDTLSYDAAADVARMALQPKTGRSHQLRLHMQAIGHPMLGDPFYAPAPIAGKAERLCLHAAQVRFIHPATGDWIAITATTPF
jgi:tRNA pseudouridine32 synthase/23S rRNA pseudouridine746 synthase